MPSDRKKDTTLLDVSGLKTWFFTKSGIVKAVNDVSFSIGRGKVVGLVGESGSGKSVLGYSILQLVDTPGRIVEGAIEFEGQDLLAAGEEQMRSVRGARIAMVFQDPMATLNPVLRVGVQMTEALHAHEPSLGKQEARRRCRDALVRVGIPAPEARMDGYPHQLSGGMRQRVVIATAMLNNPSLIIADEPTTALDVTIQAQILHEMKRLIRDSGMSLLWVSHDLSVVAEVADVIVVMYAGRIVETGSVDDVLERPRHPYTRGLLGALPTRGDRDRKLTQIPGVMPSPLDMPTGCEFRNRCSHADEACLGEPGLDACGAGHSVRCFHPLSGAVEPVE